MGNLIGHLEHFLLDFFCQIWTQCTMRHILGPILVFFEICHFLAIPGPFEYFSENGCAQKIKVFSMKEQSLPLIGLVLGGEVPRLKSWANLFPNPKHLRGCYRLPKVKYHFFDTLMRVNPYRAMCNYSAFTCFPWN